MKKKNYNPFKLWGSYVGAFLGIGYGMYTCGIENGFIKWCSIQNYHPILGLIIGFLIGWGIHSFFRKISK